MAAEREHRVSLYIPHRLVAGNPARNWIGVSPPDLSALESKERQGQARAALLAKYDAKSDNAPSPTDTKSEYYHATLIYGFPEAQFDAVRAEFEALGLTDGDVRPQFNADGTPLYEFYAPGNTAYIVQKYVYSERLQKKREELAKKFSVPIKNPHVTLHYAMDAALRK
jgi:hypothetical protein